jgi:hypothetical protein
MVLVLERPRAHWSVSLWAHKWEEEWVVGMVELRVARSLWEKEKEEGLEVQWEQALECWSEMR